MRWFAAWPLLLAAGAVALLGAFRAPAPASDGTLNQDSTFAGGEELVYNVSYLSFDIGQVRVNLRPDTLIGGKRYLRAVAHIDSYKGIPFVDLHAVYETRMAEEVYAVWFHSRNKQDDVWRQFTYDFDYPKHLIHIVQEDYASSSVVKRDTMHVDTLFQDGLSLFYFARRNVHSGRKFSVPTIVSENRGMTQIDFSSKRTEEEVDAIKYPVDVVHFEGEAGFVGIFGLTGGFEGWFSNDAAQIPILARMKVILGSVKIELIKWKRAGWTPPRAGENK
jgi:hypothetical protein